MKGALPPKMLSLCLALTAVTGAVLPLTQCLDPAAITASAAVTPTGDSRTPANDQKEIDLGLGVHLYGHSLSLGGSIGVNFYMELDDAVAADGDAYMQFTLPSGDTAKVFVGDADTAAVDGKQYYVFQCKVSAKEMTGTIKAQMFCGSAAGDVYEYTVKEYADYLLANSTEYADAVPLVKAMLNYGAAAQNYFGYLTDSPANVGYKIDLSNISASTIYSDYEQNPIDYSMAGDASFAGATLSLKSEVTLSLYFKSSKTLCFDCYPFTYLTETETTDDGYQILRIRNISAANLFDSFSVEVKDAANAESMFGHLFDVYYSPMDYCYKVLDGGSDKAELQDVCRALYLYAQAAKDYCG